MSLCLRCDFESDPAEEASPRQQLLSHATDSQHPLCIVCARSLTRDETQCCEKDLTATRATLAAIVTLTAELPHHLGHLHGVSLDGNRGGSDDRPLPGGDVLVMLAGGGMGVSDTGATVKDGDVSSVTQVLCQWEDAIRHTRGDPAAMPTKNGPLASAAGYLEVHMRWAATTHPAFDELHADLRKLHAQLLHVTGRSERKIAAEAECFDCGGDLVRLVSDRVTADGVRIGGYDDHWTCERCGKAYAWERYLLALRERLLSTPAEGWSLPAHVALVLGVPVGTVLTWMRRGHLAIACVMADPRQRVQYEAVAVLVVGMRERRRLRAEALARRKAKAAAEEAETKAA